jgi:hypothetical protein
MPQLDRLIIHGSKLTNTCIVHVGRLPRLRSLWLSIYTHDDNPPPLNLAPLAGVSTLRDLCLLGPCARKVDLTPLEQLPLESIDIEGGGDQLLEVISRIKSLRFVNMEWDITNEGLLHLSELPRLQTLALGGTFDDAGLHHLHGLKQLRHVQLRSRGVSEKGIAELLAACPSLKYAKCSEPD